MKLNGKSQIDEIEQLDDLRGIMNKSRFLTVALVSILLIAPLACRNRPGDGEGKGVRNMTPPTGGGANQ